MSDIFTLERVYNAPLATLWRAWTEPELLERWYKPIPSCDTSVLEHNLVPGGVALVRMQFGDAAPMFERWIFQHIEASKTMTWKQAFVTVDGDIAPNAKMPDWPRVMRTSVTLSAQDDGVLQRLTWEPSDATDTELACFRNASEYLDRGWVAGFDSLEQFLKSSE